MPSSCTVTGIDPGAFSGFSSGVGVPDIKVLSMSRPSLRGSVVARGGVEKI